MTFAAGLNSSASSLVVAGVAGNKAEVVLIGRQSPVPRLRCVGIISSTLRTGDGLRIGDGLLFYLAGGGKVSDLVRTP